MLLAVEAVPGTPHISEDQDVEKELFWWQSCFFFLPFYPFWDLSPWDVSAHTQAGFLHAISHL